MDSTAEEWRKQWVVGDADLGPPHAVHSSGFAVSFVHTELEEDGPWGWCAVVPRTHEVRVSQLRASLGSQRVERLFEEALTLWRDLGHVDEE